MILCGSPRPQWEADLGSALRAALPLQGMSAARADLQGEHATLLVPAADLPLQVEAPGCLAASAIERMTL